MTVEGEDAFCVDINTNFRNGYKTRADASIQSRRESTAANALPSVFVGSLDGEKPFCNNLIVCYPVLYDRQAVIFSFDNSINYTLSIKLRGYILIIIDKEIHLG